MAEGEETSAPLKRPPSVAPTVHSAKSSDSSSGCWYEKPRSLMVNVPTATAGTAGGACHEATQASPSCCTSPSVPWSTFSSGFIPGTALPFASRKRTSTRLWLMPLQRSGSALKLTRAVAGRAAPKKKWIGSLHADCKPLPPTARTVTSWAPSLSWTRVGECGAAWALPSTCSS